MRLVAPAPDELADLWPIIRDRIASCCKRSGGKYEPVDVLQNLINRRMDLWLAVDDANAVQALAITEIVDYPRVKVCKLLAGTGDDAERWYRLIDGIENWARSQGCGVFEPICRPGWEKRFAALGYRKTHVVLEKRLA